MRGLGYRETEIGLPERRLNGVFQMTSKLRSLGQSMDWGVVQ